MKKWILFLSILLIVIILTNCNIMDKKTDKENQNFSYNYTEDENDKTYKDLINELNMKIAKLEEDITKKENDIKLLEEERDYYREFIDSQLETMNKERLINIAKQEVVYSAYVKWSNSEGIEKRIEISDSNKLVIENNTFDLIFVKKIKLFPIIQSTIKYKEVFDKIDIPNLKQHITISNYSDYISSPTTALTADGIVYHFETVPNSTEITVQISSELQEKLNMDFSKIEFSIE
ncbi:hypothetical protein [Brassicibacter mesophilus]|uniref:hypothetical protein n=1 Tax=Brassicibacter mesophilus TaxID=745119 RepID=UPI003D1AA0E5